MSFFVIFPAVGSLFLTGTHSPQKNIKKITLYRMLIHGFEMEKVSQMFLRRHIFKTLKLNKRMDFRGKIRTRSHRLTQQVNRKECRS